MKLLLKTLVVAAILLPAICFSKALPTFLRYGHHPFYIGVLAGYGSTDWSELVAQCDGDTGCQADLEQSVPKSAGDSGITSGVSMGYEIQPHFAFEASFIRFPNTVVVIAPFSYYFPNRTTDTRIVSHTYSIDIIGKFMVQIINTSIRAFADAGMAITHRHDILNTFFHINPTFGIGLNYVFAEHWMVDGEFQYIAGYDKSTLTPIVDYSPFLYSLHLQLSYRF